MALSCGNDDSAKKTALSLHIDCLCKLPEMGFSNRLSGPSVCHTCCSSLNSVCYKASRDNQIAFKLFEKNYVCRYVLIVYPHTGTDFEYVVGLLTPSACFNLVLLPWKACPTKHPETIKLRSESSSWNLQFGMHENRRETSEPPKMEEQDTYIDLFTSLKKIGRKDARWTRTTKAQKISTKSILWNLKSERTDVLTVYLQDWRGKFTYRTFRMVTIARNYSMYILTKCTCPLKNGHISVRLSWNSVLITNYFRASQ